MDRTNTWFRRTVLSLVLLWSFPAGAITPEVERLANEAARHADLTQIIIVSERHNNVRLADELLELLTLLRANDKFDCLFVEFETDLQDEFDRAVNEVDIDRLVEAIYLSRRPLFLAAFRKFGYESNAQQAYIASSLDGGVKERSKLFPVNRRLLIYLRENKVSLLPYDAHSRSKAMFHFVIFNIRISWRDVSDAIPEPDADMRVAIVKNSDTRNSIMAQNIIAKFASYQCNKAVVVVGEHHTSDKAQLERFYGVRLDTYTPLQIRLEENGLPSVVAGKLLGQ